MLLPDVDDVDTNCNEVYLATPVVGMSTGLETDLLFLTSSLTCLTHTIAVSHCLSYETGATVFNHVICHENCGGQINFTFMAIL